MTPPTSPETDAMLPTGEAIRRTMIAVAATGAVLCVGAALWSSFAAAGSVALGAGAAVLNLFVLERVVAGLTNGGGGSAGGIGLLKLLILFGGSWGLFRAGLAEAMPFAVGFGALPIGITLSPLFLKAPVLTDPTSPTSPGARGSR